jgi:molecular chaperone DnaJ
MPPLRRGRNGDLRVIVNVVIPRRLDKRQKELLRELADSLTAENLSSEESMFTKLRRSIFAS